MPLSDLSSITALITAAGSVIGLANKTNSVEANQKIIELQQRMAEVQLAFAELFEENQSLKEQNRSLREEIGAEALHPFCEGVRWKKDSGGDTNDGPFCPVCFASKKVLMPLRYRNRAGGSGMRTFECPEQHVKAGMGRETVYVIKEESVKSGRYVFYD